MGAGAGGLRRVVLSHIETWGHICLWSRKTKKERSEGKRTGAKAQRQEQNGVGEHVVRSDQNRRERRDETGEFDRRQLESR